MVAPTLIQRSPNLAEQVYNALRQDIIGGQLTPGQTVVIEHLAAQLGVSPTPVREALARLLQKGLITQVTNGKLHVIELTEQYVREVFLVRGALEGLAAELACEHITDAQLATLRQMMDDTTAALEQGDYRVYSQTDAKLHQLIKEIANNTVLNNQLEAIESHIEFIRGYSQRHAGWHVSMSHQEHLRLLQALVSRDPQASRVGMEQHIRGASERIIRLLDFHNQGRL